MPLCGVMRFGLTPVQHDKFARCILGFLQERRYLAAEGYDIASWNAFREVGIVLSTLSNRREIRLPSAKQSLRDLNNVNNKEFEGLSTLGQMEITCS